MKKIIYFSLALLLLVSSAGIARFTLGGSEDTWLCKDGQWVRHGNPTAPKPTQNCGKDGIVKTSTATPKDVVESFYSWYTSYEGKPLSSGAYKTSDYLTEAFREKVDSLLASFTQGGYDPILCAQDIPQSFTVAYPEISGSIATVAVTEVYSTSENSLLVTLEKDGNQWLIDDVTCGETKVKELVTDTQGYSKTVIYFSNPRRNPNSAECGVVYGVERTIPVNTNIFEFSLQQLFRGPTESEKSQGFSSFFSQKTKDILLGVDVKDRVAYVNLKDIRTLIPNVSSSCGSAQFLAEVEETLKHNKTVDKIIMAINGDPELFYEWIQIGCTPENNNCDDSPFKK